MFRTSQNFIFRFSGISAISWFLEMESYKMLNTWLYAEYSRYKLVLSNQDSWKFYVVANLCYKLVRISKRNP